MKTLNTIELFAGIGGFRVAADKLKHKTVWANDICPKASKIYCARFGERQFKQGNVNEHLESIPKHDLLTGGFPCQPFSSAGKKRGVEDPRGTLFQVIVDVLKNHQPKYFVLENVKRLLTMEKGRHFATILSSLAELNYDIEWRLLNAMHFGLAQNRQRVFILGVRRDAKKKQTFKEGIRLAKSIELENLNFRQRFCLGEKSSWMPIEKHTARFPNWGIASEGNFFALDLAEFVERSEIIPVSTILEKNVAPEFDFTESTQKWLSKNTDVNRYVGGVEILSNQAGGARMGYTIFGINGVAPTLTSTTSRHYERYKIGDCYRRLTNIEYARIQGFPDDHCSEVSVYDQYALIGNAVPPPMAGWVLSRITAKGIMLSDLPQHPEQRSLFDYAS